MWHWPMPESPKPCSCESKMASSPTTISHWQEATVEQAKMAINRVVETSVDEDAMLDRLQALRAYIEELMSAIR